MYTCNKTTGIYVTTTILYLVRRHFYSMYMYRTSSIKQTPSTHLLILHLGNLVLNPDNPKTLRIPLAGPVKVALQVARQAWP